MGKKRELSSWHEQQARLGDRLRQYHQAWQDLPEITVKPAASAAELIDRLLPQSSGTATRS